MWLAAFREDEGWQKRGGAQVGSKRGIGNELGTATLMSTFLFFSASTCIEAELYADAQIHIQKGVV